MSSLLGLCVGEPYRAQDDAGHHERPGDERGRDRGPRYAVAGSADQGPRRKRQVEERRGVDTGRDPPLHERGQYVEEDGVDEGRRGNDQAERRSPPSHSGQHQRGDHEHGIGDKESRRRHHDPQCLRGPLLPAGEVFLRHVKGAGHGDDPERPFAGRLVLHRRPAHKTVLTASTECPCGRGAGASGLLRARPQRVQQPAD